MGCRRGDVLGIILPNVIEYPMALYGAAGVGMPVALINPMCTVGK
jgi:4-coumarate--CoA ligase